MQQGFFSVSSTCSTCRGRGSIIRDKCDACRGSGRIEKRSSLKITVPAGIADGQRLKLSGEGEAGDSGRYAGDLYVVIRLHPHAVFKRYEYDVVVDTTVSFPQAALGGTLSVPTLDGDVELEIPAGTASGEMFKLKGKGITKLGGYGRGDQHVRVHILVPKKVTPEMKELLQKMDEICLRDKTSDKDEKSFLDKVMEWFS